MSNKIEKAVKEHFHSQSRSLGAALREFCTLGVQTLSWCLGSLHLNESGGFEHQTQ